MKKKVTIIIIAVLTVPLTFAFYMGLFDTLEVQEEMRGPYHLIYKRNVGPYKELGPLFQEMYKLVEDQSIAEIKLYGIYYDHPEKVEVAKLRSEVGVIIETRQDLRRLQENIKTKGVLYRQLGQHNYALTHFPYKNMLSIYMGLAKAYPQLEKYMRSKGHNEEISTSKKNGFAMEIYEKDRITYMIKVP